jgi:hypothetical protein
METLGHSHVSFTPNTCGNVLPALQEDAVLKNGCDRSGGSRPGRLSLTAHTRLQPIGDSVSLRRQLKSDSRLRTLWKSTGAWRRREAGEAGHPDIRGDPASQEEQLGLLRSQAHTALRKSRSPELCRPSGVDINDNQSTSAITEDAASILHPRGTAALSESPGGSALEREDPQRRPPRPGRWRPRSYQITIRTTLSERTLTGSACRRPSRSARSSWPS